MEKDAANYNKSENHGLDATDRMILNRIQSNFPISQRPYSIIAKELSLSEEEVISRVRRLKAAGIIRRIGGNFSPDKLGFVSTLCAGRVPEDRLDRFLEIVNSYQGVTHNYLRENDYNVWFTVIAPSMDEITRFIEKLKEESGVHDILNLPATKVFKIRAHFKL